MIKVQAAEFVDINASADFMGPGTLETNKYQTEIVDMVKRRLPLGQKIAQVPATGHPSRYFEQIAIPTAGFTDPRQLTQTPSIPKRVERVVYLKAISGQINFSFFDTEVTRQQGDFAYLEAKDLNDLLAGSLKVHDLALWQGNDTSMFTPTTVQYYGISGQIFNAIAIGDPTVPHLVNVGTTDSLVDKFKTQIAAMINRTDFEVSPSGIYLNSLLGDKFDQEAKATNVQMNEIEVIPGVIVKALATQAGPVPLVQDPGITVFGGGAGGTSYYTAFITMENMIEYHYLTTPLPRVFQLGLQGNLAGQFVVVKFGAVAVKGAGYAHAIMVVNK